MTSYLDLPAEIQQLIEKRELDERRLDERRKADKLDDSPEPLAEQRENERRTAPPRRTSDS